MAANTALLLLVACLLTSCSGQVTRDQPDSNIFAPVQNVGNLDSGTFVAFYGCADNGATLSSLTLWANAEFIRGMSATLTDGREVLFGCVNVTQTQTGGCNDTNIRSSSFTFQAGETVTNLTLWAGYNVQKQPNQRAGALNLVTSRGRVFDFGMTDNRTNPVSVTLGSGIPCGVAPRAGADIDALGFVFLLPVTSSVLQDVQYSGIPSQQGNVSLDVAPLDENVTSLVLSDQIYNNSGKTTNLVAMFSSEESVESPSSWSTATGLDSYLQSAVNAAVPQLAGNGTSTDHTAWALSGLSMHNRSENPTATKTWNYTVDVQAGGVSEATATAVQAYVATSYTGNLSVALSSGKTFSVPVSGSFEGQSTSSPSITVSEIQAPIGKPASGTSSTGSKGSSNTLAWVLGVLFGVLGGLLFAALLAWAIVIIVRRRNAENNGDSSKKQGAKQQPGWSFVPGLGKGNGKCKPGEEENIKAGQMSKDIELGAMGEPGGEAARGSGSSFSFWGLKGKKAAGKTADDAWKEVPDPKVDTVMGVPVSSTNQGNPGGSSTRASADGLPESAGRFVVPYNMFRRLRLESIRQALGLEAEQGQQRAEVDEESNGGEDNSYTPPAPTSDVSGGLSNPPSGASTPRALSPTPLGSYPDSMQEEKAAADHEDPPSFSVFEAARKPVSAAKDTTNKTTLIGQPAPAAEEPEEPLKTVGKPAQNRGDTDVPAGAAQHPALPALPAKDGTPDVEAKSVRSWRLKDRVAAIMAASRRQNPPAAQSIPPATDTPADAADAASVVGSVPSDATSRDTSVFSRMARSISSMTRRGGSSSIQHDDAIIALKGRPVAAEEEAASTEQDAVDVAPRPSSRPSTPKRPKVVAHEDAELRLGEGYNSPPEAKSIQKDAIELDNKRIKLGVKYATQGRNE